MQDDQQNTQQQIENRFQQFLRYQKRWIFGLIIILSTCFFISGFYIAFQLYTDPPLQINDIKGVLAYIQQNLQATPIEHLIQVQANDTCNKGYFQMPIYTFPGIAKGCLCPNDNITYNFTQCPNPCQPVEHIDNKTVYIFKDKIICVKYVKVWELIAQGENCSVGYKQCMDYMCVGQKEICPINHLVIAKNYSDLMQKEIQYGITKLKHRQSEHQIYDTNVLEFYKQYKYIMVYITTKTNLFVSFNITENGPPCYNTLMQNILQSQHRYPLIERGIQDCGQFGQAQQQSILADKQNIVDFWKENQIYSDKVPLINEYYDQNDKMSLFIMKRISIFPNRVCYNFNVTVLTDFIGKAQNLRFKSSIFVICLCLLGFISLFIGFFFYNKNRQKFEGQQYQQKKFSGGQPIVFLLMYILNFIMVVGLYYFYGILKISYSEELSKSFSQFINMHCYVDEQLNSAINIANTFIKNSYHIASQPTYVMMAFTAIFIVGNIYLFIQFLRLPTEQTNNIINTENYENQTEKVTQCPQSNEIFISPRLDSQSGFNQQYSYKERSLQSIKNFETYIINTQQYFTDNFTICENQQNSYDTLSKH